MEIDQAIERWQMLQTLALAFCMAQILKLRMCPGKQEWTLLQLFLCSETKLSRAKYHCKKIGIAEQWVWGEWQESESWMWHLNA